MAERFEKFRPWVGRTGLLIRLAAASYFFFCPARAVAHETLELSEWLTEGEEGEAQSGKHNNKQKVKEKERELNC